MPTELSARSSLDVCTSCPYFQALRVTLANVGSASASAVPSPTIAAVPWGGGPLRAHKHEQLGEHVSAGSRKRPCGSSFGEWISSGSRPSATLPYIGGIYPKRTGEFD